MTKLPPVSKSDEKPSRQPPEDVETEIDDILDDSFPASDPPNWSSVTHAEKVRRDEKLREEAERKKIA
jgi:hypothetical protein